MTLSWRDVARDADALDETCRYEPPDGTEEVEPGFAWFRVLVERQAEVEVWVQAKDVNAAEDWGESADDLFGVEWDARAFAREVPNTRQQPRDPLSEDGELLPVPCEGQESLFDARSDVTTIGGAV